MPDTHTLVVFYLVAMHRSYRLAAEELGVTVSALSRPIQRLERQLGAVLFIRGGQHETRLTEAGSAYLREVEKVLLLMADLPQAVTRRSR